MRNFCIEYEKKRGGFLIAGSLFFYLLGKFFHAVDKKKDAKSKTLVINIF